MYLYVRVWVYLLDVCRFVCFLFYILLLDLSVFRNVSLTHVVRKLSSENNRWPPHFHPLPSEPLTKIYINCLYSLLTLLTQFFSSRSISLFLCIAVNWYSVAKVHKKPWLPLWLMKILHITVKLTKLTNSIWINYWLGCMSHGHETEQVFLLLVKLTMNL